MTEETREQELVREVKRFEAMAKNGTYPERTYATIRHFLAQLKRRLAHERRFGNRNRGEDGQ